jgi:hypothetical protein
MKIKEINRYGGNKLFKQQSETINEQKGTRFIELRVLYGKEKFFVTKQ